MLKLTTKEFIKRANKIHNNQYDYSKVNYIDYITKVVIICKQHGEFSQQPRRHLIGGKCKRCSFEKLTLSTKEFIKRSQKIHNNKYDYSKVNYINSQTKIIIICREHGEFKQIPNSHLFGKGCCLCGGKNLSTIKDFIKKAKQIHGNKYNYSKVNYINSKIEIEIICLKHGKFKQTPNSHLSGRGCHLCNGGILLTTDEFVEKAKLVHGCKYDYSKTDYSNAKTKIIIICKKHGEFLQEPDSHTSGTNCPNCSNKISKSANKWLCEIEKKLGYELEREYEFGIGKCASDGYDPNTNTIYEYYGSFWHGNPDIYKAESWNPRTKCVCGELYQRTLQREIKIRKLGYNLITKWGR